MLVVKTVLKERHIFESRIESRKLLLDTGSGKNDGQSPVEAVLSAVASCSAVDVLEIIEKKRKSIKSLVVETSGDRKTKEEGYPRIFKSIHLNFCVISKDVEESDLEQAISLSVDKYCSVAGMLKGNTKITYSWTLKKI